MSSENLNSTGIDRNKVYRITAVFDNKQVLAEIGEKLIQAGIISGIDLRENNLGIYCHKGRIYKRTQYTLAIYLTANHDPKIAVLIEDIIRDEIRKYWDTPAIMHDSIEVNRELVDFIEQSVPIQQKIIKQRNLIRALALSTIIAGGLSAGFFTKNYVENERQASVKAFDSICSQTQTKYQQEMLEKIGVLRKKIYDIIAKNGYQIGCEQNQLYSTPFPNSMTSSVCQEHEAIMQEISNLEKEIYSQEQCPNFP